MTLQNLLGWSITHIHEHAGDFDGWIARVLHYLRLDTGALINLPYTFD